MDVKTESYDVVVVGGGPAGMTAALYAGRARLKTLLVEESLMGGRATYTSAVENYPGFLEGGNGVELMERFDKHLRRFDVDVKIAAVKNIAVEQSEIIVSTPRDKYIAKSLVIATGSRPRLTGANNEEKFLTRGGILFCATRDTQRNAGKTVVVIGSGDAAIEEGLYLATFAKEVIVSVIHDEGTMDANKLAQEKAMVHPKMSFVWNTVVDSFEGGDELERVVLKHIKTGELFPVPADSCFLFIGYRPNTELVKGLLRTNKQGFVVTNESMETEVPGIFVVGDCREKFYRKIATAVGDGAIAGFMAEKYVEEVDYVQNEIFGAKGLVLAYVFDASESYDRGFLARVEKIQSTMADKVKLRRIDIYKSDRIAARLAYEKSPSLIFIKNGEVLERRTDLTQLDELMADRVAKYG